MSGLISAHNLIIRQTLQPQNMYEPNRHLPENLRTRNAD
jgi:hypothetical protein